MHLRLAWDKAVSDHPLLAHTRLPGLATSSIQNNFGWMEPLPAAAPTPQREVALATGIFQNLALSCPFVAFLWLHHPQAVAWVLSSAPLALLPRPHGRHVGSPGASP